MEKEKDINVNISGVQLNCRAVGIIKNNNRILFQKRKQDQFWALPGGKIRVREKSSDTLVREIEEEIGVKIKVKDLFSVSEYFFNFKETKFHQYIFAYNVEIVEDKEFLDKEEFVGIEEDENLLYKWFDLATIETAPIKPDFLKEQLSKPSDIMQFNFYEEK
jgi:mutator protein MutT